jgi:hypothetical protein
MAKPAEWWLINLIEISTEQEAVAPAKNLRIGSSHQIQETFFYATHN